MTEKLNLPLLILSLILILGFSGKTRAFESNLPFCPGEKLTFKLKWNFIPAGEAVFEVFPPETIEGINTHHYVLTVKTNPFIDLFYKVRERIDAYADLEMSHSILYKKNQKQGKRKRDIIVTFDWKKKEAQYSNFKKKEGPISILPGTLDPLSVFYYSRLVDLEKNTKITIPVTDGKKCIIGNAVVKKKERIKSAAGTYDTYLLEPELKHFSGVFEKSKNATFKLWISADKRKIPVKIQSNVSIGNFTGELIKAENSGCVDHHKRDKKD